MYEMQLVLRWKAECRYITYSGKEMYYTGEGIYLFIYLSIYLLNLCRPLGCSCHYHYIWMMLGKKQWQAAAEAHPSLVSHCFVNLFPLGGRGNQRENIGM